MTTSPATGPDPAAEPPTDEPPTDEPPTDADLAAAPDFADDFDASALDPAVWVSSYLPAWSSRAESTATWQIGDSCLELSLPPDTGWFLPGRHAPLRVSGIQSGNFSGAVGSTRGQQPPFPDAIVREEQPLFHGWTPTGGHLEMRARVDLSSRSMAAWWLVGLEVDPAECAEI